MLARDTIDLSVTFGAATALENLRAKGQMFYAKQLKARVLSSDPNDFSSNNLSRRLNFQMIGMERASSLYLRLLARLYLGDCDRALSQFTCARRRKLANINLTSLASSLRN